MSSVKQRAALWATLALFLSCHEASEKQRAAEPRATSAATRSASSVTEPMAENQAKPTPSSASTSATVASVAMPKPLAPPELRQLASDNQSLLTIFDSYGFPRGPELTHYCARRFFEPAGAKVTMDVFASQETRQQVAAFYEKRLGTRGIGREPRVTSWRLPPTAKTADRVLSVTEPQAAGRHTSCPKAPPADAKSLLVLTRYY